MQPPRTTLALGLALATALPLGLCAEACGGETSPQYGSYNTLPQPPSGTDSPTPPTPDAGGADTGGGGGGCPGGGTIVSDATCAVKFSTQLYPKMIAAPWHCADAACHGSPGTLPTMLATDSASAMYTKLVSDPGGKIDGKFYFNPCSKADGDSKVLCNLGATTPACGAIPMPQTGTAVGAVALTAQEQTDWKTWVECGAPNN